MVDDGGNWVNVTYISEESQPWRVRVRWRKGNEDNRVPEFQEVSGTKRITEI